MNNKKAHNFSKIPWPPHSIYRVITKKMKICFPQFLDLRERKQLRSTEGFIQSWTTRFYPVPGRFRGLKLHSLHNLLYQVV